MLDWVELKTAVWIYDIDNSCIYWANNAALAWWESDDLAELKTRTFEQDTSHAVKETLKGYQEAFYNNHSFTELWHFSPKGIEKKAYCQFSGTVLPDGRMAMLIEATSSKVIPQYLHDSTATTVATFDINGHFQSCNPPFGKEFGDESPSLWSLLCDQSSLPLLQSHINNYQSYETDLLLHTKDGKSWFRVSFIASKDALEKDSILCQFHNINNRKKRELQLVKQANTDALTGLLNRRGFKESMQPLLDEKQCMLVFYIDLDGFKMINDSLGHSVGDLVLKQVASRLHDLEFVDATFCRFGGDEFVVVVPDPDRSIDLIAVSNKIVNSLSAPYHDNDQNLLAVSASIGIAKCPDDSLDLVELIRFADAAMYYSKKQGKKRSTVFSSGMEKEILRKSLVTQHLSVAIAKDELYLHYQPIINTADNSIYCFEALLRWNNPELGQVSPQELIEVAERVGLIAEIENWVISTAVSHLHILRKYTKSNVKVAVNVSSMHLINSNLAPFLKSTLAAHQFEPSDLIVEVTESVLFDGLDTANNPIEVISDLGTQISIDDFGTGYSSLAYLYKINASSVKIDRAFVNLSKNSVEALRAIHDVISSLGMASIIEGIETEQHAINAKKAGIALQQGYWYSKPKGIEAYRGQVSSN